jgi:hypothetical protein
MEEDQEVESQNQGKETQKNIRRVEESDLRIGHHRNTGEDQRIPGRDMAGSQLPIDVLMPGGEKNLDVPSGDEVPSEDRRKENHTLNH